MFIKLKDVEKNSPTKTAQFQEPMRKASIRTWEKLMVSDDKFQRS